MDEDEWIRYNVQEDCPTSALPFIPDQLFGQRLTEPSLSSPMNIYTVCCKASVPSPPGFRVGCARPGAQRPRPRLDPPRFRSAGNATRSSPHQPTLTLRYP